MTVDFYGDSVVAFFEKGREVELRRGTGILRVAHFFTITPEVECRGDSVEGDSGLATVPAFGECEGFTIRRDWIWLGGSGEVCGWGAHDEGRVFSEGILHVRVDGGAVSLELDIGGDWNGGPVFVVKVGFVKVGDALAGLLGPAEFPITVEKDGVG